MAGCKFLLLWLSVSLVINCQDLSTKPPISDNNNKPQIEDEKILKKPLDKQVIQKSAKQENLRNESENSARAPSAPVNNQTPEKNTSRRNAYPISPEGRRLDNQKQNSFSSSNQEIKPKHTASRRSPTTDQSQAIYPQDAPQDARQGRRLRDQDRNYQGHQGDNRPNAGSNRPPFNQDNEDFRPYSFNYIAETDEGTTSHQQSADRNGRVSGSYSMELYDGRKRVVDYNADEYGFRAKVDTNEPGTSSEEQPADATFYTSSSRPGIRNPQGIQNRQQPRTNQGYTGQNNNRMDNRDPSDYGTSDRSPAGSRSEWGRPNPQRNRDMTGPIRGDEYSRNQPRRNPTQRAGRDMILQNQPDALYNNLPNDPFSDAEGNYGRRQGAASPRQGDTSRLPRRGASDQAFPYQPAEHRIPSDTMRDNMPRLDGGQYEPPLDPTFSRASPRNQQQQQPNVRIPDDGMSNIGEFRQTRPGEDQNDSSFHGWFRRSSSLSDDNSGSPRHQGNAVVSNRRPQIGDTEYMPGQQGDNMQAQNLPRQGPSRYNLDSSLQNTPYSDVSGGRSQSSFPQQPSHRSSNQFGSNRQPDTGIRSSHPDTRQPDSGIQSSFPDARQPEHGRQSSYPNARQPEHGRQSSYPNGRQPEHGRQSPYPNANGRQPEHGRQSSYPNARQPDSGIRSSYPDARRPNEQSPDFSGNGQNQFDSSQPNNISPRPQTRGFDSSRSLPNFPSTNQRDDLGNSGMRPNIAPRYNVDDPSNVPEFGRRASSGPRQPTQRANDDQQMYDIRVQPMQPNRFDQSARQDGARTIQNNFNDPQQNRPGSHIQSSPLDSQRRPLDSQSPDVDRGNKPNQRDSRPPVTGEVPRNFQNYGTYWFSSS